MINIKENLKDINAKNLLNSLIYFAKIKKRNSREPA
jgi:hypothetical protein